MAKRAFWGVVAGGLAAAALATTMAFTVPAAAGTSGQALAVGQSAVKQAAVIQAAAVGKAQDPAAVCDRLKKTQDRRHAVATRLQADENTRGSIAWLTAKAAAATASGNTARATLYTDKAALRTAVLGPLQTVAADVDAIIAANCG